MDSNDDKQYKNKRIWVPIVLLLIGSSLLLRQLGFPIPNWLFTWPMILIVIGFFKGLNSGFRKPGAFIMMLVGAFFLIDEMSPDFSFHRFLWPVVIICMGIFLLIKPGKKSFYTHPWPDWNKNRHDTPGDKSDSSNVFTSSKQFSSDSYIDDNTVFGGIHRTIVSKDFKGGDITVFMGGTELNLSQADINGTAYLDITQILGGTKLIVPAHWEIRSQVTTVFGNIEDKRQQTAVTNPDKILVIDGTSIFGGIEIRNY